MLRTLKIAGFVLLALLLAVATFLLFPREHDKTPESSRVVKPAIIEKDLSTEEVLVHSSGIGSETIARELGKPGP